MIEYQSFDLPNGLKVIVHEDRDTQLAVLNLLYDVGSRDEDEHKTGFAHLFEHLMFGGSRHIESYDQALERVGGENNAFTSPDITNYYLTVPANNIETGFWLESDRMLSLSFDPRVLEVQRSVVIEEFKQRYLNQPYGDVWLKLRPLAYKNHPYKWATIGKEISHIEGATMQDVKDFFYKHYVPNNATLVVAGNVSLEQVRELSEKWFGDIPAQQRPSRSLPPEEAQTAKRSLTVEADVPAQAIYKVFHMPGRFSPKYHTADLLSDILGRGKSSRLYQTLVQEKRYFSTLNAYVTGSIDPGLLVISGKLHDGIRPEKGEEEIDMIISEVIESGVTDEELNKVKAQAESTVVFSEVELLNRAMNLAYYSLSGEVENVNRELDSIKAVTKDDIHNAAQEILRVENSSIMYYGRHTNK